MVQHKALCFVADNPRKMDENMKHTCTWTVPDIYKLLHVNNSAFFFDTIALLLCRVLLDSLLREMGGYNYFIY